MAPTRTVLNARREPTYKDLVNVRAAVRLSNARWLINLIAYHHRLNPAVNPTLFAAYVLFKHGVRYHIQTNGFARMDMALADPRLFELIRIYPLYTVFPPELANWLFEF